MIAALGTPLIADHAKRLFLTPAEVTGDPALAGSYLSATGWQTFETYLRANFASLLVCIAASHSNVHVFNSAQAITTIQAALPGTTKTSGDWVNEIHLTWQGYEKVAEGWVADMGTVLV